LFVVLFSHCLPSLFLLAELFLLLVFKDALAENEEDARGHFDFIAALVTPGN